MKSKRKQPVKTRRPIRIPTLDPKAIGERIKSAMKTYDWTGKDLARVAGMPYGTFSAFMCGSRVPSRDNAIRICLALRRALDWLLLGKWDRKNRSQGSKAGSGGGFAR